MQSTIAVMMTNSNLYGGVSEMNTIYFTKKPHKLIYRPSKTDDITLTHMFKPYCNRMVIDNSDE